MAAHIASTTPGVALQAGPMVKKADVGTELTALSVRGPQVAVGHSPMVVIPAPSVMAASSAKGQLAVIPMEQVVEVVTMVVVGPTGRLVVEVPALPLMVL